ncbi:dihydrolipoyl dehydrogenase [Alicyclobacillus tolerans]|uniref:dihydrolipoyl dehydrogenase n=1 Tax=Alicyclobacillus tolerans TaxID=90970 RepID=UPI001F02BBC4|nr:dihydrolipoyl dehydrogenase [Alicyclobacillus tolerans]MCF8563655.1 dihydrolipoyl dehydrogenase [Alicyclobacillus tolerans]
MPEENYDVVIIGGGTGGYVAAIRAAQLGLKVCVVEKSKMGGTCLHQGCIPSKALLRSAEILAEAKRAQDFGVIHSEPEFDLHKAMERKNSVVDQLYKGVLYLMKKNNVHVIEGVGRVMGPSIFSPQAGSVLVELQNSETQILSPRNTLIATGSRPKSLPGLELDGVRVISSDEALALKQLPESALIIGAGAIGVEWASMLNDFGVDVTLVEFQSRVLPMEDEDVANELARIFKKRKIRVLTSAKVLPETLVKKPDSVQIHAEHMGSTVSLEAEVLLVAVGRAPNTEDIGLEATQVRLNGGYIEVNGQLQTAEENIFAIGDAIGGLQLAHVAAREGIRAVEVMAGLSPAPLDYNAIGRCTYSRPEVACVGLTEEQARSNGHRVKTGKFSFRAIGKALVFGEQDGFVKVVADEETDDVLGVHMIGPHVTDLISEAGLAQVLNATPWEMASVVHPHPTLSEALGEAALAVDGKALHG